MRNVQQTAPGHMSSAQLPGLSETCAAMTDRGDRVCLRCKGLGYFRDDVDLDAVAMTCPDCYGTGVQDDDPDRKREEPKE